MTGRSILRTEDIFISIRSAPDTCKSGACAPMAASKNKSSMMHGMIGFPHISPDGKWIVFLSYDADVRGHPENKNVMLRMMPLIDEKAIEGKLMSPKAVISVLAKLFGGQGTINVPAWSPDSKEVAFVSYALVPNESAEKIPDKTSDKK